MSTDATDRVLVLPLPKARPTQVQAHTEGPMASVESDEEVLYRVRSGDSDALLTLFRRYGRLIFSIGCRILGDAGEAEDLVQEVFLRLSAEQRSFDSTKGSARTWMIQMVYRRAFDRRSYLSRRHFYSDTSVLESPNAFIGVRDFEEDLIERLTAQQLRAAFGELSDKQRETLELFFFEGLKLGEIAERSAEDITHVRHHYYRGLERLRQVAHEMIRNGKST